MAQKVEVELVDDMDGSKAEGTVQFGLDGTEYEIDLSTAHASALREFLEAYVKRARLSRSRPAPRLRGGTGTYTPRATRAGNREIRDWARVNGIKIQERGRIPGEVAAQYETAMSSPGSS